MSYGIMEPYYNMLDDVLCNGEDDFNERTNKVCRVIPGYQIKFDLSRGEYPLLTGRQMFFKGIKGETLGFYQGADNASLFRSLGCNLWNANANQTPGWLANPNRKGLDDLGRVYGVQWTKWKDRKILSDKASWPEVKALIDEGFKCTMQDPVKGLILMEREINQLEKCLAKILTDPSDRRIIYTGWNPAELDLMALPPCHMDYRFTPMKRTNKLHMTMTIRSWDLYLGGPTNIASAALQQSIMAKLSGYQPGTLTIQATNAHIYEDHYEQVRTLLNRSELPSPSLTFDESIKKVEDTTEIAGIFARIKPEHIILEGYEHHERIDAPMAI